MVVGNSLRAQMFHSDETLVVRVNTHQGQIILVGVHASGGFVIDDQLRFSWDLRIFSMYT